MSKTTVIDARGAFRDPDIHLKFDNMEADLHLRNGSAPYSDFGRPQLFCLTDHHSRFIIGFGFGECNQGNLAAILKKCTASLATSQLPRPGPDSGPFTGGMEKSI